MSTNESSRVHSLLAQWELEHSAGRELTPEILCQNDPELLDQVRSRLERLQNFPAACDETKSFGPNNTVPEKSGLPTPMMVVTLPTIPNITIERVLGQGGMGVVYLARQVQLNRLVAIKMIRNRDHLSDETFNRFRAEAETLARFQNPHVVHVYEVGEHQGQPYIIMEYIEGKTLREVLANKPLLPQLAAEITVKLTRAMQSVHERAVIHRDLKPSNVILDQKADAGPWKTALGCPKIIDFGLVKQLDPTFQLTIDGQQLGTASYMAPEQARGDIKSINASTDVYALGAILYEMLTGTPPFTGGSVLQIMEKVKTEKPASIREQNANVPARLEAIALKCLAKKQTDRYSTASELANDLDAWLNEKDKDTVQFPAHQKSRWLIYTSTLVVLAGFSLIFFLWMSSTRDKVSIVSPQTTTSALAQSTSPTALSIMQFDIKHYSKQGKESLYAGILGKKSFHTVFGDQLEFGAQLSEPAYSYLIAFATNGKIELCYPEYESTPPSKDASVRYPPATSTDRYGLTDGTGLYAFAIVCSRNPLPSFKEWMQRHPELSEWKKVDGYSGVIYEHNGASLRLITSDGLPPKDIRGKGDAAPDKEALERIAKSLKKSDENLTIRIIAFQVSPDNTTPKVMSFRQKSVAQHSSSWHLLL